MIITKTDIPGLFIIEPKFYEDERGYFCEIYKKDIFEQSGLKSDFIQDNQSKSLYGVIRGLHYQLAPFSQTKLIRVLYGEIFDVVVDIRKNSPTFSKWYGIKLSSENKKQLYIPKGFAHGFSVLSDYAEIMYKCDSLYNPESEAGINYNDKKLNINWQIHSEKAIVSTKDKVLPDIDNAKMNFIYGKI
ncbi:MAG: dTDP-4-dehydrorhamnose 3,5-epimerase [Bacteroidales bacterium]|nr:dTDP-4-dehydrorhamnose 3,5-epimerase [Bacteroidales bacterium]